MSDAINYDPSSALGFILDFERWILDKLKKKRLLDPAGRHAVDSAMKAIHETRLFLRDQALGVSYSRKKQDALSRLWLEAGISFRGIDNRFANRCSLKSDFWMDPQRWTEEELAASGILLIQVESSVELLAKLQSPGSNNAGF